MFVTPTRDKYKPFTYATCVCPSPACLTGNLYCHLCTSTERVVFLPGYHFHFGGIFSLPVSVPCNKTDAPENPIVSPRLLMNLIGRQYVTAHRANYLTCLEVYTGNGTWSENKIILGLPVLPCIPVEGKLNSGDSNLLPQ